MKLLNLKGLSFNKKKRDRRNKLSLTISLSLLIFLSLLLVFLASALFVYILTRTGVIKTENGEVNFYHILTFMLIGSVGIGIIFSVLCSKLSLRPFNQLISKMNSLATGDFKERVKFGRIANNISAFNDLSSSFNKLASELENTEMLRSDFINNFSHEFKTPIVSISGLAKVLKKGKLTDEERLQYLSAIEEESMRLSYMATNVLNLTKIENQAILTDVTKFNVSEQIRGCILLLESKWAKKELELQLELEEYEIFANEELLKQVFINLIDNAVKFSRDKGTVLIVAKDEGAQLAISITNYGAEIPKEKQNRIFNKFYQADESHSTEGNGIGLAIVKKIVDLHSGDIQLISENDSVTFTVTLPKKQ